MMTNSKRSLITSVIALIMCLVMFLGTTYAWFTDSVTSGNNVISSGNLDISMSVTDGTKDPLADSTVWTEVSEDVAIFDYDKWEPGYVEAHHIKIANDGTLALKYKLSIIPTGTVSKLAEVIDVYYTDPAKQIGGRTDLTDSIKLGSLKDVLDGLDTSATGNLSAKDDVTVTVALKMRESANNDYQGLSIGSSFTIRLDAAQYTEEYDSFDNTYDALAEYEVVADGGTDKDPTADMDTVSLSAADIANITYTDNTLYKLTGTFDALTLNVPTDIDVAFDGTDATVTGTLLINESIAHSYSGISGVDRVGSITVQNMTAAVINVNACNKEEVNILNNKTEFIGVIGGNIALNINGNDIDSKSSAHSDGEGSSSKYGISMRIADYELSIKNNTVTNTSSHVIGLNGRNAGYEFGDANNVNKIVEFSGNKLIVTSGTDRACFKIWSDATFAPENGDHTTVNSTAQEFINSALNSNNTFDATVDSFYKFCIYDAKTNS